MAVGWGAVAGGIAALVYTAMTTAQHVIWPPGYARWYIPLVILAGGGLIALLRPHTDDGDVDDQLKIAADPTHLRRKRTATLALSAVIAYGFGGAIGPEAGLLAVVAELSALVSARIARSENEARIIGKSGSAAALAGLYGSPPGAAAYDGDSLAPAKLFSLLAAGSGFIAFLVVHRVVGAEHTDLGLPTYVHSTGQLAAAIVPALAGAATGFGYTRLHALCSRLLARQSHEPDRHSSARQPSRRWPPPSPSRCSPVTISSVNSLAMSRTPPGSYSLPLLSRRSSQPRSRSAVAGAAGSSSRCSSPERPPEPSPPFSFPASHSPPRRSRVLPLPPPWG